MKKKLVYILNQYSEKEGSHFHHILNLLEEIASNGIEIILIIEKSKSKPKFTSQNIQVVLQKRKGILRPIELIILLLNFNRQGYKKVFIRISQWGAIPAIILSKFTSLETYFWHSGTTHRLDKQREINIKTIKWFFNSYLPFRFVVNHISFFVTGPETMINYYNKQVGVKEKKLLCLYNDIDLKRFKKISEEDKYKLKLDKNLDPKNKIILFVHRFSPVRKSLFYMPYILNKALKDKNNICIVIGGGPELQGFKKEVVRQDLSAQIQILGEIPNSEIQEYYSLSDIFINPTYTEGFPRVVLEAMASGLPIVTTNAGGIQDLLGSNQLEYMSDIENRDEFSELLFNLIGNTNVQSKLINENIKHVKRFNTDNVAKMYINKIFKSE